MQWPLLLTLVVLILPLSAQDLLTGYRMYSYKKKAYVQRADGKNLEGTLKKLKRKKGLIQLVVIEEASGKSYELEPDQIHHMYLAPAGFEKFAESLDETTNLTKWDREDVDSDLIKEGYAYFEQAQVDVKGKSMVLLMQLLNPGFSQKLRVYFDPLAQETGRTSVGAFTVGGGLDKSYYLMRPDGEAFRMKKKDYKKGFEDFYADCPSLLDTYPTPDWRDFAKHVFYYGQHCQ